MKKIEHKERAHSRFAASAAERWMECTASVALCETCPPSPDSVYSLEGTEAHECLEAILRGDFRYVPTKLKDKYPHEMVDHAHAAAHHLRGLRSGQDLLDGAKELVETRVEIPGIKDAFGTLDYAVLTPLGPLRVWDFKYGSGKYVSPHANPQLMYYAVGLYEKYNEAYDFTEVELGIIQPRCASNSGDVNRSWTCSIETLMEFKAQLVKAAEEADDPTRAKFAADATRCRWCPAKQHGKCPELGRVGHSEAREAFSEVPTVVDSSLSLNLPTPDSMDAATLAKAFEAAARLTMWVAAVKEKAYKVAGSPEGLPGFKLVAGRAKRVWNDKKSVELDADLEIGDEAFNTTRELKNLPDMEKVAGKDWVNARCSKMSGSLELVPNDDPRHGTTRAVNDFAGVSSTSDDEL